MIMALNGSRQRLVAVCGSLAAFGGAIFVHRMVSKKVSTSPMTTLDRAKQRTKRMPDERLKSAIYESRTLLNRLQTETNYPGLAITVSLNGETVWKEGFGFSDLENGVRCTPDTVMKIASVSKPITMMLVAKEWEKGNLDLDADVRQYVPYWPEKDWQGEKVILTPRQLSSHMAGIRDYKRKPSANNRSTGNVDDFEYEEYYITKKYESVKQSLDIFKDDPLVSKPGTEFQYTTHGFTLLSAVLEGATSKTFMELMQSFFDDLGLSNTFVEDKDRICYNLSRHYVKGDQGLIQNAPFTETSFKIAGAGLLSTTNDLTRFGEVVLYGYQQNQGPRLGYLTPSTTQLLWTPIASTSVSWDEHGHYGMGWQIVSGGNGRGYVGHTGGTVGASSALVMSLEGASKDEGHGGSNSVVVAILCNLQSVSLGRLAVEIGDKFLQAAGGR